MNATQAHKKTGVLMRIAAYHAKNFEFIDTIEFSMEPVSEQQEYVSSFFFGFFLGFCLTFAAG